MMERVTKYYTPKLEEFHIGFEYEEKFHTWEKRIFDGTTTLVENSFYDDYGCPYYSIEEDIKESTCRVKYLDHNDIESFGFEFEGGQMIPNGKKVYRYREEYSTVLEQKGLNIEILQAIDAYSGYRSLFKGKIKNKLELKKVLQMIGVL